MYTTLIAVDVAKSVFQVAVSHTPGKVHAHHRLTRARFERFFREQPATNVLMEACGSAHHWARELQAGGHRVSLLPPAKVSRYRDGTKTDRPDDIPAHSTPNNPPTMAALSATLREVLNARTSTDDTLWIGTDAIPLWSCAHPWIESARRLIGASILMARSEPAKWMRTSSGLSSRITAAGASGRGCQVWQARVVKHVDRTRIRTLR